MRFSFVTLSAALLGSTCAIAAPLPTIERSDLAACMQDIGTFHDKEIDYMARETARACDTNREHFDKEYCARWQGWLKEDIAKDDVEWWMKGNPSCEATDYPCWGPSNLQDPSGVDQYMVNLSNFIAENEGEGPPKSDWDNEFGAIGLNYWSFRTAACVDRQYLGKLKTWKATNNPDDSAPEVAAAEDTKPADTVSSEPGPHAANCIAALTKQDDEFNAMNLNAPKPGEDKSASGAKALYQMGMYITDERLKVLDEYCKGEPQYATYPGVKASYESALTGCRQLASDGGVSCKPLKLW
jgi:hypothetical protein